MTILPGSWYVFLLFIIVRLQILIKFFVVALELDVGVYRIYVFVHID